MKLKKFVSVVFLLLVTVITNNCSGLSATTQTGLATSRSISDNEAPSPDETSPISSQPPATTPPPVVSGNSIWSNEPANFKVASDWGFDALNGGGWHDQGGSVSVVPDSTAPVSPNSVLQQRFYKGMEAGISPGNNWTSFNPTGEVYLGFFWKVNVGFQQHGSNRTKIIFLSDTGGNPLFFYMGGVQGESYSIGMQHQNSDICNDHLSGYPGICGTWDIPSGEYFNTGEWVKIELYVKKSTTTTSKDGILKYWVNGRLARSISNWNSGQNLFASVPIVPIWGGVGGVKMHEDYFWYDHIRISVPK